MDTDSKSEDRRPKSEEGDLDTNSKSLRELVARKAANFF
jgi:hypothetical protein